MDLKLSWFGVALTAGAVAACEQASDGPPFTAKDSVGIEIVTNHRALTEAPVRALSDAVVREIRDEALYRITAVQPLSGGRLAVGADGAGSVLLFDEEGALISTLGSTGEGPGEFRSIADVVELPGDSLGVYDPLLKRLTVFPRSGGPPRVLSLAELAPGRGWSRLQSLGPDLALVGVAGLGGGGQQGVYRNEETSYRIDLDGTIQATYGEFPGLEAFVGGGMMGRAPFGALLTTATREDRLTVGTGEAPEIRTYGPDGALERIVRWTDVDRTVSRERMDRFVEFNVRLVPPEQASAMRGRVATMPFAPRMPSHGEVLLSADGSMWVGEYAGPEAETPGGPKPARTWAVFGRDGVITERVQTPPGFKPFSLGEDVVWGVHWNELDVESIRAYRIGR